MKILGIFGSSCKESQSVIYRLSPTELDTTGLDDELVFLRGKIISGCDFRLIRRITSASSPRRRSSIRWMAADMAASAGGPLFFRMVR